MKIEQSKMKAMEKLFRDEIQKSRQQALEDVNKLLEPEWDDKEMEGKKFNYRRRIGYRDMLRDELREKVKMLKEK